MTEEEPTKAVTDAAATILAWARGYIRPPPGSSKELQEANLLSVAIKVILTQSQGKEVNDISSNALMIAIAEELAAAHCCEAHLIARVGAIGSGIWRIASDLIREDEDAPAPTDIADMACKGRA